jgi:hypothetical protein
MGGGSLRKTIKIDSWIGGYGLLVFVLILEIIFLAWLSSHYS